MNITSEQYEYLKKNFELKNGKLATMTTIGQLLIGEDQVIEQKYVKNNVVDNIDGLAEFDIKADNSGVCPNFYEGREWKNFSEKFRIVKSIKISIDENDTNPLTINHNDLKEFSNSNVAGNYGSIFF